MYNINNQLNLQFTIRIKRNQKSKSNFCSFLLFLLCRWAAIASYLPQRTDNDIKNYWNTHFKKQLKMLHASRDSYIAVSATEILKARNPDATSICSSSYASSTENISRLLEAWMRSSPNANNISIVAMDTVRENQAKNWNHFFRSRTLAALHTGTSSTLNQLLASVWTEIARGRRVCRMSSLHCPSWRNGFSTRHLDLWMSSWRCLLIAALIMLQ